MAVRALQRERISDAAAYSIRYPRVIPLKDDHPSSRTPLVTLALIAANAVAFLWELAVGIDRAAFTGGVVPYEILTLHDLRRPVLTASAALPALVPPPLTILTSMFLHGGFLHLGGNMLFLWVFGNNVEEALGRARFVAFYLATGVVAALAQVLVGWAAGDLLTPMVGASGAVSGVLAAYLVCFPQARVLTLVPIFFFVRIVWIPARFFLGLWFLLQLLPALAGGGGGGVAYMAHVGGFVAGYLYLRATGGRARWAPRPYGWRWPAA
jgi:membrane associated rhomboid family serine protease